MQRYAWQIRRNKRGEHYGTGASGVLLKSTSFPLPFRFGERTGAGGVDDRLSPAANCQAGIDGLVGKLGIDGDEGVTDPRLNRRAFNDFSSCCNSPRDCDWASLFFSII